MSDELTLIYDTETNGKRPKGRNVPLTSEPGLVQLACVLFKGRRPVGHLSFFMPPLNGQSVVAPIPDPALAGPDGLTAKDIAFFQNSGITEEVVAAAGIASRTGLAMFNQYVKLADRVVAHNIQFDDPIIRAAYSRVAAPQRAWWDTPKFCTMKTLEPIMKLPGKYGYKFPTLDEAYRAYVDADGFSGAHDAMVDVDACARVLWAVEDQGHELWQLPENWPPA